MTRNRMLALVLVLAITRSAAAEQPLEFRLTFAKQALATPFTGRVFVVVSKAQLGNEPPRIDWMKPTPFFAMDVKNWQPETPLMFQAQHSFPEPFAKLPPGKYHVQAVIDRDLGGQRCFSSPGNL